MARLPKSLRQKKKKALSYLGKDQIRNFLLRVGFVLLMLGLISYWVYQLVQHMTVGLDTIRTQELQETSYVRLNLYTFRDEVILTSEGDAFAYAVPDGGRVGVGDDLATAYDVPNGQNVADMREQLKQLSSRIFALQNPIGGDAPSDKAALTAAIDVTYTAYLDAVAKGNLQDANAYADAMAQYLNDYNALMRGDGAISDTLKSLQATQTALAGGLSSLGNIQTPNSGYFYYDIDGFETHFTSQTALNMTPIEFLTLASAKATPQTEGIVGKMVYTPTWYAAAYVSLHDVTVFQERVGDTFTVTTTSGDGVTLPLTLVRMEPDANGALLVFKTQAMPDGFDFDRHFSAILQTGSQNGYRVPAEALLKLSTKDGDLTGVYVLEGNVVAFRRVMVKMTYDSYVLVETYEDVQAIIEALDEEDRENLTAGGYGYLNLNDRIITRGTGLYDGKIIS